MDTENMDNTKVELLIDIPTVGKAGDIVTVPGYMAAHYVRNLTGKIVEEKKSKATAL